MSAQILDYSLTNFKIVGLAQYTPPFGTKKEDGKGLTTTEITRNEMMPFLKQRSINGVPAIPGGDPPMGVITEDAIAQPIEFNATFAIGEGVTLQLDDPSFEGQRITIVASFSSGDPATLVLGIAGTPEEIVLEADETYMILAVNGKWKTFRGGGSGEKSVTNVINTSSYNPGTGAGGISWLDPTVPFDHLQIEDLLNPGNPVNVAPGVQKFSPTAGNHKYAIRTVNLAGNVIAEVEVGELAYEIIYTVNILAATIPVLAPKTVIIAFDNFVTCNSATGFSVSGITDSLTFVDQPDGKSVRLQLASKMFLANTSYTISYSGSGSLKQADSNNVPSWLNQNIINNSAYASAIVESAQIPQAEPNTLVVVMSRAVKNIGTSNFTLDGTSATITSVVSPVGGDTASTVQFGLSEPVDGDLAAIRLSMTAGGMTDDQNQQVAAFPNQQVTNNSTHTAIGVNSAVISSSNPASLQVIMEGAVSISGKTSGSGIPTGWSLTGASDQTIQSWTISDGTISFTLSGNVITGAMPQISYDGTDSTFKATSNNDTIRAFSVNVTNNSQDTGGVPPGSSPRNLAITLLGHEVTGPSDVTEILTLVHNTISAGNINNLVIGDYFGLASVNIAAGNDAGGAFSANLTEITGHGRNLDFVLVSKNGCKGKNGNNNFDHAIFQSRNVLSAMSSTSGGGHYMNPTNTNVGGYSGSKGRAFIINQVQTALQAAGIPFNDNNIIATLIRKVANGGSGATGADDISDKLFIPTEYEIQGATTYSHGTYEVSTTQGRLEYYQDANSRIKYKADAVAVYYWEASPRASATVYFCYVNIDGTAIYTDAHYDLGIAPAFPVK
jgi:Tfp pilus assembly major pilin PilA